MNPLFIALHFFAAHSVCVDSTTHPFGDTLQVVAFQTDSEPPPGTFTSSYWDAFRVDSAEFSGILATFVEVSKEMWEHGYSHVAGGDRTGWARLGSGETIRWFVRPGGLAILTWPDGHVTFLVACRTGFPPPDED